LFGERSFDAVSLRDITGRAKANLGAVNYHFGSKQKLIREVLSTLASPINEKRLNGLAEYQEKLTGDRPNLETVIRLFVDPFVRSARDKQSLGIYYPRLLMLARTLPGNLVGPIISEQHDSMAREFVKAIGLALPDLKQEELFWRYDFMVGAMLNIIGDAYRSYRLKRLSGGVCDTDDPDRIVEELVAFVAAGMCGSAPVAKSAVACVREKSQGERRPQLRQRTSRKAKPKPRDARLGLSILD
jgi:AcrR family transcriptional regulator